MCNMYEDNIDSQLLAVYIGSLNGMEYEVVANNLQ